MKYWDRHFRNRDIVELSRKMTVKELGAKFELSARTIQRVLNQVGAKAKRK